MSLHTKDAGVCPIVGAGPGNGAALAKRFSTAGYRIGLISRDVRTTQPIVDRLEDAAAFAGDATNSASLRHALADIARQLGPVDVLVYNAGKGVWGEALQVSEEEFERAWRLNAFGLFNAAREVLPAMLAAGRGTIVVMGATASRRGRAQTAAFAAAKGAQRLLAESLARAYGPKGVHVALLVVDAVVGEPLMRAKLADRPDDYFCMPPDIAETVYQISRQPRSAWTFECDLRPYAEAW
jgi:NAD(P)-dependent dehydrogenase (short-subunit alcohol dehydrogenase family)